MSALETDADQRYQEPGEGNGAGGLQIRVPKSAYERFIETEEIPIYSGGGIRDVRELDLAPWPRIGGRGAYICMDGATQLTGIYVVHLPPGGVLQPERHMFEKYFFVVEGRGSLEAWVPGDSRRKSVEWSQGSLLAVPMNAMHRLVNGTNRRALLIAGTNAPPIMNLFDDNDFVFANDFRFAEQDFARRGFFDAPTSLLSTPETGRAMYKARFLPDIVNQELPLDNHRAPGFRRIEPRMGGRFFMFIGEYPVGRYSTAHHHESGAVLVCIKGSGYTFNWPVARGTRPWAEGHSDSVETIEYVAGGMVAAAPGGGAWFHQHFGSSEEPLRTLAFIGGLPGQMLYGSSRGGSVVPHMNQDLTHGGNSIAYRDEDRYIRAEYTRRLSHLGVDIDMPDSLYE